LGFEGEGEADGFGVEEMPDATRHRDVTLALYRTYPPPNLPHRLFEVKCVLVVHLSLSLSLCPLPLLPALNREIFGA